MSMSTLEPGTKPKMSGSTESELPRRWWRRKWVWLIGTPLLLVSVAAAVFAWGAMQPRPEGYALASPGDQPAGDVAGVEQSLPVVPEIVLYTLDARDIESFVLFDLDTGSVVEGDLTSPAWDLAFRRTKLLTNSGVTNPAGTGGALDLGEVSIEDAVIPDSPTFVIDSYGGDDGDEALNEAAGRWYTYSFITHIVTAKPNTYLVRTTDGMTALVQFQSYYCEDAEPGCITFQYQLIPSP